MLNNGFIKRFLPFFATFALGLVIASLIGGFSGRRFGKGHNGGRHQQMIELHERNIQLEAENRELRQQIGSSAVASEVNVISAVPAPPVAPVAPIAPVHHNHK